MKKELLFLLISFRLFSSEEYPFEKPADSTVKYVVSLSKGRLKMHDMIDETFFDDELEKSVTRVNKFLDATDLPSFDRLTPQKNNYSGDDAVETVSFDKDKRPSCGVIITDPEEVERKENEIAKAVELKQKKWCGSNFVSTKSCWRILKECCCGGAEDDVE